MATISLNKDKFSCPQIFFRNWYVTFLPNTRFKYIFNRSGMSSSTRYRSPCVTSARIRKNISGNTQEETDDRRKVASSPETRTRHGEAKGKTENKCATRATQRTTIPEMPLQIRTMPARWCARQFKRTVRLFPPPTPISFFFSLFRICLVFRFSRSILLFLLGRAIPSSLLTRVF